MKPTQFLASFKEGPLLPLYYFYGDDLYLQDQAVHRIVNRIGERLDRSVNFEIFSAASTPPSTIIDAARTSPLFGKRKTVLVKDAEKFTTHGIDLLLSYSKPPRFKTVLVFTGKAIKLKGEALQAFTRHGMVREFKHPYPNEMTDWIGFMAKERGRTIDVHALNLLVELIGNNLQSIANAMEKLCLYAGERQQITRADVEAVISPLRVESIFELTDYIGNRNLVGSFIVLSQLLQSGEAPLRILAMIARHFRMIMKACSCLDQLMSPEKVRSHLKVREFVWDKLFPQAQKFSQSQLERCFQRLWEADLSLKSQRIPGKIILEQLIADLCAL